MMKKTIALACALTAVASMAFAAPVQLKVSTVLVESDPVYKGLELFRDNVKKRTNGDVEVQIFPSSQLGSDEDVIEQARLGTNVGVITDSGRLSAYNKDFGIFAGPYFIRSTDEIEKVVNTPTYKELAAKLQPQGLRLLSFNWFQGERHLFTKIPATKPADLTGVRIRSMGNPVANATMTCLGGKPVTSPWAEAYQSLENNVYDAVEVHYSAALGASIPEVTKYLEKTGHFFLMTGLLISQKWFDSLSTDYQKIIDEEAHNGARHTMELNIAKAEEFEKELVAKGLTISQIDKQAFIDACKDVYKDLGYAELKARIDKELGR
ncbi:MAG: C4-dicarboxylate TRAP transporter substrate-binding protein [Zoogloeaceae bacterium]|jgi:tripartite ATP-independent transporter DctP family solute receptor|nr:C4-dicarboxylate TRAP transporter substrate-binding protein [Zoogloeaceae bacterium]